MRVPGVEGIPLEPLAGDFFLGVISFFYSLPIERRQENGHRLESDTWVFGQVSKLLVT